MKQEHKFKPNFNRHEGVETTRHRCDTSQGSTKPGSKVGDNTTREDGHPVRTGQDFKKKTGNDDREVTGRRRIKQVNVTFTSY